MKDIFLSMLLLTACFGTKAQTIETLAGNGTLGYSGDGGPATSAEIQTPSGLILDANGNLYFSDVNNTIRKITPQGTITTIAGNGTAGYSGDGGPATAAELNTPLKPAIDKAGNIYFADYGNYRVRMITPGGIISTVAGNGTSGFSGDGGPATNAQISNPSGMAIDYVTGLLLISDDYNSCIRQVSSSGIISTIGGTPGTTGDAGDGGSATAALLRQPFGVCSDTFGNIYIADSWNEKIRMINAATGIMTTVAGTGIMGFSGNGGAATAAQLADPAGVYVDDAGDIFIGDQYNNMIREVSGGIITTITGTGAATYSGDGGPATAAALNGPNACIYDRYGDLIVDDNDNARIRIIGICGNMINSGPTDTAIYASDTAYFTVNTYAFFATFQWQQYTGSGWVNLTDTTPYGGVTTDSLQVAGITASDTTMYRCVVSTYYSCPDTSGSASLLVATGINSVLASNAISIYPNPATTQLTILSTGEPITQICITDLLGQIVYSDQYNSTCVQVNIANLPCSVYLAKINGSEVRRFVKE